jgi:hypothetical protein
MDRLDCPSPLASCHAAHDQVTAFRPDPLRQGNHKFEISDVDEIGARLRREFRCLYRVSPREGVTEQPHRPFDAAACAVARRSLVR